MCVCATTINEKRRCGFEGEKEGGMGGNEESNDNFKKETI